MPWGGLLVLAATAFTAVTTELLPSGLLPQISRDLGVDESAVGSLTAAYAAVIVFTALPLSKFLAGRVPRKILLIATILTFALSNVLLALSPTLGLAVAARLLGGIAHGILWSTMAPYVARIVPVASMGKAMAVVFSGTSLALAVGTPIGTMMGAVLSWRTSFLVLAGAAAILGLLSVMLLPSAPKDARTADASVCKAIKQPGVIAVATAWPLLLLAHFALFTYIAPFIRAAGLPENATGISLTVVGATGLLGIWIAGLTADTYPRKALLVSIAALTATFAALPILGSSWAGNLALMAVWGTAFGAIGIYNQAAILRAGGEHRDAANGLTVVAIQVGIAIGAGYGALALTVAGALLVPLAASIPAAGALAIALASRHNGYDAGPREKRLRKR
ncbi:MFS transporter [Pseudarthrobacter sp. MDT3-28]|uniref:MFS transporter n=1 Tax=Pseudarthrobacter raffinosi TaxID=2953651 RepID=UPI00208EB76E|nr:MFS transporter [Pseudarthrobacter sp. MDT3-28]MCO4239228.1 MFS transporter [Pseudarthrobacter sp. MDT3-28]